MKTGWIAAAPLLMLLATSGLQSKELFNRPPSNTGGEESSIGGTVRAERFVLTKSSQVTAIKWYGFFLTANGGVTVSPEEAARLLFDIRVFQNTSGLPGEKLYEERLAVTTRDTKSFGRKDNGFARVYEFTATLKTALPLTKGVPTWIAISAVPADVGRWFWCHAVGEANLSVSMNEQVPTSGWRPTEGAPRFAFTLIDKESPAANEEALVANKESPATNSVRPSFLNIDIHGITLQPYAASSPGPPTPPLNQPPYCAKSPAPDPEQPTSARLLREWPSCEYFPEPGPTRPTAITMPAPSYSAAAREARVKGTVQVECVIRKDGTVRVLRTLKGVGYGLDEITKNTLEKEWRFNPAMLNGKPVDVVARIEIKFHLI